MSTYDIGRYLRRTVKTRWMDEQIAEAHKVLTKPLTKIKKELTQTR